MRSNYEKLFATALLMPFCCLPVHATEAGKKQSEPDKQCEPHVQGKLTDWSKFGRGGLNLEPLQLTEAQKSKIQQMRKNNGDKMRELHQSLRAAHEKLRDLMFDGSASEAQIRQTHEEVKKLQSEVFDAKINDWLSIRALLTPEQRKQLSSVKPLAGQPGRPAAPVPHSQQSRRPRPADVAGDHEFNRFGPGQSEVQVRTGRSPELGGPDKEPPGSERAE